jgi:hypothetical protein
MRKRVEDAEWCQAGTIRVTLRVHDTLLARLVVMGHVRTQLRPGQTPLYNRADVLKYIQERQKVSTANLKTKSKPKEQANAKA